MALLPHRRKGSWAAEKSIWEQHQDFWWEASLAMPPSLPTGKTFMMVGRNCILVYQNSWCSSSNTTKKLQFFLMSNSLSCHHGTCENVCNWLNTHSINRMIEHLAHSYQINTFLSGNVVHSFLSQLLEISWATNPSQRTVGDTWMLFCLESLTICARVSWESRDQFQFVGSGVMSGTVNGFLIFFTI